MTEILCCCVGIWFHQDAGTDKSTLPLPEPQDVFLAAQVNFDDLTTDLKQLGQDLTRMWRNYISKTAAVENTNSVTLLMLIILEGCRLHSDKTDSEVYLRVTGVVSPCGHFVVCFHFKPQPACVTLSLWFSAAAERFPQTKPRPSLASFFLQPIPPQFIPQLLSNCLYSQLNELKLAEPPSKRFLSSRLLIWCHLVKADKSFWGKWLHIYTVWCFSRACALIVYRSLILAWRLSDPASNPLAHQMSHCCAFVPLSPAQGDHGFPLM